MWTARSKVSRKNSEGVGLGREGAVCHRYLMTTFKNKKVKHNVGLQADKVGGMRLQLKTNTQAFHPLSLSFPLFPCFSSAGRSPLSICTLYFCFPPKMLHLNAPFTPRKCLVAPKKSRKFSIMLIIDRLF